MQFIHISRAGVVAWTTSISSLDRWPYLPPPGRVDTSKELPLFGGRLFVCARISTLIVPLTRISRGSNRNWVPFVIRANATDGGLRWYSVAGGLALVIAVVGVAGVLYQRTPASSSAWRLAVDITGRSGLWPFWQGAICCRLARAQLFPSLQMPSVAAVALGLAWSPQLSRPCFAQYTWMTEALRC